MLAMLAMIEINLLPEDFRPLERTPRGLFLTIVIGLLVVLGIGAFDMRARTDLRQAEQEKERLAQEKARWEGQKKEVDRLKKEIEVAQKRQMTIIGIAESKIMWSQKLCQLGRILSEYPLFWIDRLTMDRATGLTTTFYVVTDDFTKVAEFREAIQNDTDFWYHFKAFEPPIGNKMPKFIVPSGPGGPKVERTVLTFAVKWPLK